LWMIHVTFFGPNKENWKIPDFSLREMSAMAVMIISLVVLGLFPQPFLNTAGQAMDKLQNTVKEYRATSENTIPADHAYKKGILARSADESRGNQ
jgi:NADH-quinone oxidoreductase subunit M